jgi:predicted lipoprotein with Yx(FWY)xxD motif
VRSATLKAVILVNQGGLTLYHLTTEKGKKLRCTGACVKFWPPLLVPRGGKPLAGKGIAKKKLGTIRRPDRRLQVTYAGLALYRYAGDLKAGETRGQGVQNTWFAISPSGRIVKTKPSG